jgi:hypothetical protein
MLFFKRKLYLNFLFPLEENLVKKPYRLNFRRIFWGKIKNSVPALPATLFPELGIGEKLSV